jgi:putative FmdB family regulatory protein
MPIFEYACPNCGHVFEKLLLKRQQEPPECPQCGWKHVEQKFSTFATVGPIVKCGAGSCAPAGGG